ncbi:Ig-like domain repeat protein, partial [Pseudomonas fulva]|uniref:Ig-like domain-containing protein n=1 Tax=Pseudomonas fulva TaxID=47880 RepID=UPI0015F4EEEC
MENIVVADKQSAVATQNAWGNITLNGPGVVQMPVAPDQVATVTQRGQDLIVTLKSGEKVTIGNFFAVNQAGVGSDMVFVGEDGTLWQAEYDAQAFTGFTFNEVASLDELVAGIGTAGDAMPTWAIAGLGLLGVGGGAAAVGGSGGGGGGGGGALPDTTAPATPIDLLVSPDGLRLSGRGEAGAIVNIRDAAGNLLGTGTVGADGSFDIALNAPQINNENLQVTLTDAAGNVSAPGTVTAPDATAPLAPTELAIDAQGTTLTGRAEPGSTVSVRGADGVLLGSATAGADGLFSITLQPAQTAGQALQVTAEDAVGNTSAAAGIVAPVVDGTDTTAPDAPVALVVSADGTRLSGRGEPGTTVNVRDPAGNVIGSGVVGANGAFEVVLTPAQLDSQNLQVTLTDAAGNVSAPGAVVAPDLTAPLAPTNLAVDAQGATLTGRAEPGSTVSVRGPGGALLGTAIAGADGLFSITLQPPQTTGQALAVSATDAAGNTSPAANITAPLVDGGDTTPPDAPVDLVVGLAGTQLSGRGEAGTTVQVRDAAGNLLATGTVGANGTFTVSLDPAVKDGSSLQVTLTDAAGNTSPAASVASPDLVGPAQPTDLALADGVTFTGRGEPGATVQVRDAAGAVIGTGTVGADGAFSITLSPAQANGQALDVRLVDAAGNASTPLQFDAPDITPPAAVTNVLVGPGGTVIGGRGEPGATVEVRDANGTLLGSAVVTANGTFLVNLDPAVQPGEQLSLVQTDPSGNASPAVDYEVP